LDARFVFLVAIAAIHIRRYNPDRKALLLQPYRRKAIVGQETKNR